MNEKNYPKLNLQLFGDNGAKDSNPDGAKGTTDNASEGDVEKVTYTKEEFEKVNATASANASKLSQATKEKLALEAKIREYETSKLTDDEKKQKQIDDTNSKLNETLKKLGRVYIDSAIKPIKEKYKGTDMGDHFEAVCSRLADIDEAKSAELGTSLYSLLNAIYTQGFNDSKAELSKTTSNQMATGSNNGSDSSKKETTTTTTKQLTPEERIAKRNAKYSII